jgi:hypothetical protein
LINFNDKYINKFKKFKSIKNPNPINEHILAHPARHKPPRVIGIALDARKLVDVLPAFR